jgi:hypothetical protein
VKVRGKVTPRMRARVKELATVVDGQAPPSNRAIAAMLAAEGMELSHVAVGTLRQQAGLAAPRRPGGKGRAAAPAPVVEDDELDLDEDDSEPPPPPDDLDEALEAQRLAEDALLAAPLPAMPALPDDAPPTAVDGWNHLRDVRALASTLRAKVFAGDLPITQWVALAKEAREAAREVHRLLPPAPPDPEKDPANIQARAMVLSHVVQSIEAVEARRGRLCPRCMGEVSLPPAPGSVGP